MHLAGYLGNYTKSNLEIEIPEAANVLDLLGRVSARFPQIRQRVLDDQDRTRPYVNIFVNEENIRDLQRERTRIKDGDDVYILASTAGG